METSKKAPQRIAKVIARAGVCSRRAAEVLIESGKVTVNGTKITSPALNVTASDIITVDGKPIEKAEEIRIWRYHKPAGLITSYKDTSGRPTVFANLPRSLPRVISVGRLDFNSEGLLLLTNDGEAARFMESPSTGWKRKYRVRVHGEITPEIIGRLKKGIHIDGIKYGSAELTVEKKQGTNTWASVTITEGKNREIRKMMEFFGLSVTRLIRISYGAFQLGNLGKGEVDEVPAKTIKDLLGKNLDFATNAERSKKNAHHKRQI